MEKLYKGSAKVAVRARKACGKCGPRSCQRCRKSFSYAFFTCKKQCKKVSGKAGKSVTSLRSRYCRKHLKCCDPFRRFCSQCKKMKGNCFTRLRACGCKRLLQCPSRGSKGTFIGLCWLCPMRHKRIHNATQPAQTSPSCNLRNNKRRQQYKSRNAGKDTKTRGQRAHMKRGMERHDKNHRTDHKTRPDSKKHRHREKKAPNDGITSPHIFASLEEGQSSREEAKASGKKSTRTKEKSSQERHKRTLRPSSKNSEKRKQETARSIEEKSRPRQERALLTSSEVHAERNETTRKTKKKSGAQEHKKELPVSLANCAGSEYDDATINNTGTSKTQKENGSWRALPGSREVKIDEQKAELQVNEVRRTAVNPAENSKKKAKQSRAPARDKNYYTLGKDNSQEEKCQNEEETSILPASTAQGIQDKKHQRASNSKKPRVQSEKRRDLNSRAGTPNESKRFQQNILQEETFLSTRMCICLLQSYQRKMKFKVS
ncbi:hypothetical protein, conserved [Eimeria necatrix]|uniref:Uncharacterized protein n=1 Tax=Eimeria necatrix TaxID=51315 RepID=U6N0M7_9EIME|nr:hypothetical protein, conserved [Eimeria necatrix]CDJ69767.1 hypothetical protein, conserved [Eimeria necatrix]